MPQASACPDRALRWIAASFLIAATGCTDPPPVATQTETACSVSRVVDGDTVVLNCPGSVGQRARLVGFDTPEVSSPRCPEELALGRKASARLEQLVRDGRDFTFSMRGHDRYDRALVAMTIDGRDVADTLVSEGLAYRYSGGPRRDWCALLT